MGLISGLVMGMLFGVVVMVGWHRMMQYRSSKHVSKGRPKGVTPKYSLTPLVPRLSELLGVQVKMENDCIGAEVEKLVAELPEGGVLLLENVRFYKEEEKNDPEFAKKLASLADVYVNDSFGTAHRAHASTEGVAKYLKPSVVGFLMQKVNVVRQLPEDVLEQYDHNISSIINLRLKGWSSPNYYLSKVLPKLLELRVVRVAPFSNRLAQAVPPSVQELRCYANFEALRFSDPIRAVAERMVQRMVRYSFRTGGKYVYVHLRFEKDMVAFSCCIYDGGAEEKQEMDIAREKSWRGKFRRRGRVIRPGALRRDGKCPLTPLEEKKEVMKS